MKTYFVWLILVPILFALKAFSADNPAREWGAISNDVQISLRLKDSVDSIKTNEPCSLWISIRTVSTNKTLYIHRWLASRVDSSFMIEVISPSGKSVSPAAEPAPSGSGLVYSVPPNQIYEYEFKLSDICKFNEVGTYTIVAKKCISFNEKPVCWVTSNPLSLTVTPGEWKTTNAPSSGYGF